MPCTAFDDIDEMILCLYYLYENSPKECRELEDVLSSLRECVRFESGCTKPMRASGTQWISHKLNAMKRIISKYGAYTTHIASLMNGSQCQVSFRLCFIC